MLIGVFVLSMPEFGFGRSGSTKEQVIKLLAWEWPLSVKKIHVKLQKQYGTEVSYQAIHKTIGELEKESIIAKRLKGYQLNVEWIQKSKKVLEGMEKKYLENEKINLPEDFQGTIQLEFDSITSLSVSTAELLLSRQLAKDTTDPSFICLFEYGWWSFKFRFEHLKLLYNLCMANPGAKCIIRKKTPFGKWIAKQYAKVGGVIAPVGTKIDIAEDLFIQGNYIIQVNFDEESKKIIEHYYKKWKNLNDIFKEFGLKPEPKIHATMQITRNPELAKYMRKQLDKAFEKGGKK